MVMKCIDIHSMYIMPVELFEALNLCIKRWISMDTFQLNIAKLVVMNDEILIKPSSRLTYQTKSLDYLEVANHDLSKSIIG
jgi:hypothetical protein